MNSVPPVAASNGNGGMRRHVCMIAYTDYATDSRVRREAETLVGHGFHVRCVATKTEAAPRRFQLDGVDVQESRIAKYRGKSARAYIASYLRFLADASLTCLRLMARGELDVVHVHNVPDFLVFAAFLPRLAGRKVILDVHDSVPETFATKFPDAPLVRKALVLEERVSAMLAHKVICVNHPQRDALVARGIPTAKTFISMNVPDPRLFPAVDTTTRLTPDGALNLVYHGTMAHRLGVDLLIEAVARIKERVPAVRLQLWGDGDDLPAFRTLARERRLDGHVEFNQQGYPLESLQHRLRCMDLGVLGNRRGAAGDLMLPGKLLEYVALGIPVVAPRLKTIAHYFNDDMVTFYEPESVESLADAVVRLYHDRSRRLRQATIAQQFLANYGWDQQRKEFVTMYESLVGSHQ
jgi:glycosyltransferase involved in cell wall biosynthesis